VTGQQPPVDGPIPMADGTAVVEAAGVEVTELKLGDHVARGQTGLAAQLLCSSCAVFHELACHQALTTQLSKAVDRERPLMADESPCGLDDAGQSPHAKIA
jgi:Zn-dependent alcohol dehydrogenase